MKAARDFGDILIVGVNSDESVKRLKGANRPVVPAAERAELLAALRCVAYVVIFQEDTPEECIKALKPDVHCKGSDYAPPHGKPVPEAALVESYGGRVCYLPMSEGHSSTELLRRLGGG